MIILNNDDIDFNSFNFNTKHIINKLNDEQNDDIIVFFNEFNYYIVENDKSEAINKINTIMPLYTPFDLLNQAKLYIFTNYYKQIK